MSGLSTHKIDIEEIARCVKNPLRLYFQQQLGIKFPKEKKRSELELPPFLLPQLKSSDSVEKAKKNGQFPAFALGKAAEVRVKNDMERYKLALGNETLNEITVEAQVDDVSVRGTIVGVTQKGLFVFDRCNLVKTIRVWPAFLLLNHARKASLFFAKDGKEKSWGDVTPLPLLKTLVEYYFVCEKTPSPLFPAWVEPILQKNEKKLQQAMQQEVFEEELNFMRRNALLESPSLIIEKWHGWAEALYGEMKKQWF